MILATDLDGTFLAGSDAARGRLIGRFLERPDARLVYVTGRSVRSVLSLIDDGTLPALPPLPAICSTWRTSLKRGRAAFAAHPV